MKFKLSNSMHFPDADYAKKLKTLGFKIKKNNYVDYDQDATIEINTLEDLMSFVKEWGPIIVKENDEIEIYDDYRE